MKILLILFACLLAFSSCTNSKHANNVNKFKTIEKGTLIIVAIGSDGIIIAADSRTTNIKEFIDGHAIVSHYRDSAQKIYVYNGSPIAYTGKSTLDAPVYEIIKFLSLPDKMVSSLNFDEKCARLVYSFSNAYSRTKYPSLTYSKFYTAGYVNNTPHIMSYTLLGEDSVEQYSDVVAIVSRKDTGITILMDKYPPSNYRKTSCKELAIILEKIIVEYGQKYRKNIGGPVSILKVNKDNICQYIKNDFSRNPAGETERHSIPVTDSAIWNRDASAK